jgi:hypothetical protein
MKTYRMVTTLLGDITGFIRDVKRGNATSAMRRFARHDPFSLYLQYRYGWKQLFRDIVGGIKLIEELENGSYSRLRVYVKDSTSIPFRERNTAQSLSAWYRTKANVSGRQGCYTRLDFEVDNPFYHQMNHLGVDPAAIAWEIVPWSFVVDWLLNVGNFLEAWSWRSAYKFLGGTSTYFGEFHERIDISPGFEGGHITGNKWYETRIDTFNRTVLQYPPEPKLAINPQILVGHMSQTRIADAIALAKTTLSRPKKFVRKGSY